MLRRVVITGLGLAHAARVRRRSQLVAPDRGPERRAPHRGVPGRRPRLPDRLLRAARAPSARASSIPTTGWSPRSSARSTTSSSTPWPPPSRRSRIRGWKADTPEKQERSGVMIGSGIGGLSGIAETSLLLKERGPRRVSPFFIPGRLINLASGYVSIRHGLKGPNHAVVTACSTGAHAIGDASRLISMDDADVMVAGGAESPISRIGVAGFAACKALATAFNDHPTKASRPYDRDRDGFVIGEGAGIVVLEALEHAKSARRAHLCRGGRLRPLRRRLPHHRAGRGRRWRLSQHAHGAEARAAWSRATSSTSMPTAPRPWATRSSSPPWRGCSAMPPASSPCPPPSRPSGICWVRRAP